MLLTDWDDYYTQHFSNYKQKKDVRDRCHPQIFKHGDKRNAIVLVHGLTDSPYFMRDIGEYFAAEMGFDVYLPLLRAHGLQNPESMKDASLIEWQKDVRFAVAEAKKSGGKVSIGGLSTGGALSVEMALTDENAIDGGVFLFAAALSFATKMGDLKEILLRTPVAKFFDHVDSSKLERKGTSLANNSPSGNPYRYCQMDIGGAIELSKLIEELDSLIAKDLDGLTQPLFAVHSEADVSADLEAIENLVKKSPRSELFRIGKYFGVPHASVVLKNPILSKNNSPLEPSNPFFETMMTSLHVFANKHNL
jgi:esterase/lipase